MPTSFLARLCLMITLVVSGSPAMAQSILLDSQTATYGNPWQAGGKTGASANFLNTRTLVTSKTLPAEGDFEILGRIDVEARWFGSTAKATKLLGEKAKSMGGNAVVESRTWQAAAFPAIVAPHGSGIAVRVKDHELLESLADSASTWE
jgi:hypothetical protein